MWAKIFLAIAIALLFSGNAFAQETITEIISVNANIHEKNLAVEIIVLNADLVDAPIKITTNYAGETDERYESVPADSIKKFTYTIHNVKPGNVKIGIENGTDKFVEIRIPPGASGDQELLVREIGVEDYFEPISIPGISLIDPYFLAAAIAAVIAILILWWMVYRWRKHAPEEKRMEKNAELLKEADEARKMGKIKKIRL